MHDSSGYCEIKDAYEVAVISYGKLLVDPFCSAEIANPQIYESSVQCTVPENRINISR